ncbi:PAS domain-containing protein [Rhizobium sp. AC44/96]|uniref:PAS domain-containing protein n=1 Tax=Rhizobium sp. AC44/96 TaxID=1841654 RepID=UPI0011476AA8|nr:PAS domain-containing protein [Rhizobium sp. AC44/96]
MCLTKGVGGAEEPQRVLLLHSFGARFSPFNAFSSAFRVDLISRSPKPIDIYEASLETARFSVDQQNDPFVDYLTALVRARPPKLVVAIGGAATRFAQAHRSELFPSTPTLFTALDERVLKASSLTANDAAVTVSLDLPAMVENILQVRPETKKIFVVIGSSPLERFWAQEAEAAFKPFQDRVAFEFSSSMSFDQIVSRVAALPPSTAVLSGLMVVDAAGIPYEEDRVIARLHEAASAPLFGLFDSQLGKGIVGGPLLAIDDLASDAANASLRMLAGDAPADIHIPPRRPSAPTFDERELARWGIPESRLPAGSVALFREPTFYETYRWQILGVLALLLIETIFVVALLEHRRRLRRTKQELSVSEERLSTAAIAADVGLWVWDIQKNDIWVSESGRQLFGLGVEGTTFEHLVKVVHPDDRRPFWRAVGEALTQRGEFEPRFRLTVPGRGLRWVSSRGRVEFDTDGKPSRMRGVAVDITGRQAAEEEARELSGRLIHAHEDERARLARELHDDVTQRLAVLAINAGRAERSADSPADSAAMYEMREELVRLSEDVHSLSYRLHPSILEDLGLEEALRAECDRFAALERTIIHLDTENSTTNISPDIALCLFRIAQEALRNVGRHADASRVRVSLVRKGDKLNLTIQDNGKGYNSLAVTGKASLGLASMRQRARLVGGTIEIESATGTGTTVFASVPLQEKDDGTATVAAGR